MLVSSLRYRFVSKHAAKVYKIMCCKINNRFFSVSECFYAIFVGKAEKMNNFELNTEKNSKTIDDEIKNNIWVI